MNDLVVTQIWQAGVMLIMITYGIFAVVGYMRRSGKNTKSN